VFWPVVGGGLEFDSLILLYTDQQLARGFYIGMRWASPFQKAHFGEPISENPRAEVGFAHSNLYVAFLCILFFYHLAALLILTSLSLKLIDFCVP
jgi:hypothetical protein